MNFNHNADKIFVSITPLSGPSIENAIPPMLERQTPASHLYGARHMLIVEPVSHKSMRKVGPGRFIPQYNGMCKCTWEGNKYRIDAHIFLCVLTVLYIYA